MHSPIQRQGSPVDHTRNLIPLYLMRFGSEATRRAYAHDLATFFGADAVALEDALSVDFTDINQHIDEMAEDDLSLATRRRRIAAVRGFYEWLVALGAAERNPANRQLIRRLETPSSDDRPYIVLTQDEADRLIEAAEENETTGVRDAAMIKAMLYLALRRSETAGMSVEDIRRTGDYWILRIPCAKGGEEQYVKMSEDLVDAIHGVMRYYDIRKGAIWRSLSTNHTRGRRLSSRYIYDVVLKAVSRARLMKEISPHSLRHTSCTLALEAGASPLQVKTHARHKHIATTYTYLHQRDKLADAAVDRLRFRD